MGSAFTFFSGRRGEIAWQKERFMGGRGRRDYDTHWAFGFVALLWFSSRCIPFTGASRARGGLSGSIRSELFACAHTLRIGA